MIFQQLAQKLAQIDSVIAQLTDAEFSRPVVALDGATIGAHVRHIIEMLQCLGKGYGSGQVDYGARARSQVLETRVREAREALQALRSLDLPDQPLMLAQNHSGNGYLIATNFFRELLYNLEHAVHHQALIKVGLRDFPHIEVDGRFGVADSTLEYRGQCAP